MRSNLLQQWNSFIVERSSASQPVASDISRWVAYLWTGRSTGSSSQAVALGTTTMDKPSYSRLFVRQAASQSADVEMSREIAAVVSWLPDRSSLLLIFIIAWNDG